MSGALGLVEGWAERSAARQERLLRCRSSNVAGRGDAGEPVRVACGLVLQRADAPPDHQAAQATTSDHQGDHEPVEPWGHARRAQRRGGVVGLAQDAQACRPAVAGLQRLRRPSGGACLRAAGPQRGAQRSDEDEARG